MIRTAASCFAFLALLVGGGAARADDPFANLPSPSRPSTPTDRGDRIRLPYRPAPEAPELAPRFPPTVEPRTGSTSVALPLPAIHTSPADDDVGTDTVPAELYQPTAEAPPPLPVLVASGSPAAPIPVLEVTADVDAGYPDVQAALASPAVTPAGTLKLSVVVRSAQGKPRTAGLTVTGISEGTDEIFFQRGNIFTDSAGRLTLSVQVPAQEGFYRLYIAAADDDLGVAVTDLRAWVRVPLAVRGELPPFSRVGDSFIVGAVVRNRAHESREILVRVRSNGAEVASDHIPITLAAGEERRIRVDGATPLPGDAVFQVAAATTSSAPERALVHQTVTVPVRPCVPPGRVTAYGIVDNALRVPFFQPEGLCPHTGGIEISVAPDPQLILTDALLHLFEQDTAADGTDVLASRILSLAALDGSRRRVPISMLPPELREAASIDVVAGALLGHQLEDGGFSPRPGTLRSDLSTSAWCATALVAARDAGAPIPTGSTERLAEFLSGELGEPEAGTPDPGLRAFTLRSLALMGVAEPKHLDALYLAASGLSAPRGRPVPVYARAWLMEAFHALDPSDVRIEELHHGLREAALERGNGITFPEDPAAIIPGSLHTPDHTDAVVLHALVTTRPSDTLIPRIASGLIGAMTNGRWSTSRADAWSLQALARYYDDVAKVRPSFEVRAWLGDQMIMGMRFRKPRDHARGRVPMAKLVGLSEEMIRIGKRGDGRLFYRIALTSAPAWAPATPKDHGLRVERTWSLVGQARAADRTGPFRVAFREGDLVRLRIRILAPEIRRRTIVDIPIPAGLQPVTGTTAAASSPTAWDAVENLGHEIHLFQDVMAPGAYEYTTTLRAATPGTWRAPPVHAHARHNPGVSGKSASEVIVITP